MPTSPIAPVGAISVAVAGTALSSTPSVSSTTLLDREAFLELLVAQLRYQDPSKPMDASAMIAQSAQLSVVDKLSEISSALTRSAVTDRLTLAGSVIGKQITFADTDGYPVTQTVTSVRFQDGGLMLSTGSWDVPLESVAAIAGAPALHEPDTNQETTP